MKKAVTVAVVVLMVVGLVGVLGAASIASVTGYVGRINLLAQRYTIILQWVADDLRIRYINGARQLEPLVDQAEQEMLAEMQEVGSLFEAKAVLSTAYVIAGMRIGADGLRALDVGELLAASALIDYGIARMKGLIP